MTVPSFLANIQTDQSISHSLGMSHFYCDDVLTSDNEILVRNPDTRKLWASNFL